MTPRPLRLRWSRSLAGRLWLLLLDRRIHGGGVTLGIVRLETARPNTYVASSATGQVLRGNNRRRLQARLRDAVCAELAQVARRSA